MGINNEIILKIVNRVPSVIPYLSGRAAVIYWTDGSETKSVEYFLRTLIGLIRAVYNNLLGGEFIDIMANLIQGQLTQAFQQAIDESGVDWIPELQGEIQVLILSEYNYVDQFFRDIVDARIDKTPIEPLLLRAQLWANRWNEAYNRAKQIIAMHYGQNMIWIFGDTDHCTTCEQLDGIVAGALEWEALGVRPQSPPNGRLQCGGWKCKCSLVITTQRRSPRAFETIMNIVGG